MFPFYRPFRLPFLRQNFWFLSISPDAQGVDGLVEVPFTRWELEEVWDPNPDAQGKMFLGLASLRVGSDGFGR